MALKGQKFKKYSLEEKVKIIEKYNEGISSSYLEKEYGISNNTNSNKLFNPITITIKVIINKTYIAILNLLNG